MNVEMIPLSKLIPSPDNVRKTVNTKSLEELTASIQSHGLLHNLIVVKSDDSGKFEVVDGSRRLLAMRALSEKDDKDAQRFFEVPCQLRGSFCQSSTASEVSLAANVVRDAMHPADEFEAFEKLIDGGATIEEISQRFGCTARHVEQRLKLAKLDKALIKAYREGALTLECLEAFTICDSKKRQLDVFNSLKEWQKTAKLIRAKLTDKLIRGDSRLAIFAGADYEAAGGEVQRDLFGGVSYYVDGKRLTAIAEKKLEEARQSVLAEGWKWATVTLHDNNWQITCDLDRLTPGALKIPRELTDRRKALDKQLNDIPWVDEDEDLEQSVRCQNEESRLEGLIEEVDAKIDALRKYSPEKMKSAGCVLHINQHGKLITERGYVKRADQKDARKADKPAKSKATEKPVASVKVDEKDISGALAVDLGEIRTGIAQYAIGKHVTLAIDILAFSLARQCFGNYPRDNGPACIEAKPQGPEKQKFLAGKFADLRCSLDLKFLETRDSADSFVKFRKLSNNQKQSILAVSVAMCCCTSIPNENGGRRANRLDETVLQLLGADVAQLWRPNVDNYFGRLTGAQLLKIAVEVLGKEWAAAKEKLPKGLIAKELEKAFADKKASAKVKAWLPPGMAFDGPVASKIKAKSKNKGK